MREAVLRATLSRAGNSDRAEHLIARIGGRAVLTVLHAIPVPAGEPAARERVGQLFLRDHELAAELRKAAGPLRPLACHRGVTGSQARRMVGCSDAILVSAPLGVWAADPIDKTQLFLLAQCKDETATSVAVQRAFEWLESSKREYVARPRAQARARIVTGVAREMTMDRDASQSG